MQVEKYEETHHPIAPSNRVISKMEITDFVGFYPSEMDGDAAAWLFF